MLVYPAIDILGGRAVRLRQGARGDVTDYGEPLDIARRFISQGAKRLHVVDLDGAFTGTGENLALIGQIAALGVWVQTGGGIRSLEDIDSRLAAGVERVVLGTAALDEGFLSTALSAYGDRIAVGVDARNSVVMARGWVDAAGINAVEFTKKLKTMGVKTVIYTDIARDGMRTGVNLEATRELAGLGGIEIIASGGIGSVEDALAAKSTGAAGVIVGKALYEDAAPLAKLIEAVENGY